ncbi:MAG: hypothetical protein FWC26_11065 [Fibromonadales bacterium]|nr:hypothetical protein [Fibromonadales bacterium]
MDKRFFLVAFCLLLPYDAWGQLPVWVNSSPQKPTLAKYYYRVSWANGATEEESYIRAYNRALLESFQAIGIAINYDSISFATNISDRPRLPLNVVCRHTQSNKVNSGYATYLLSQVSTELIGGVIYWPAFDCNGNKEKL